MNYIREIAEALSENHAALMVGAGFSKNEQELGLIKDFYDVLYINDFKLQNNDMLLKCSNMLFRISIYRVISSEILHNMAALKLCYAIIKNEIVLKTEIQTLLVCLLKLQDETVIKQTDSEQ